MQSGGQFFGVIRVDTRSEESRERISASISGSYGAFSAEVGTTFSSQVREESASVEVFAFWEGGRVTAKPTTPVELIEAAREWSATVAGHQRPYFVTLAPYVLAMGPEPPNEADLAHQRDVLVRCAKLRSQSLDKMNLLEYMLDPRHIREFDITPPPAGPDLRAILAGVALDLDLIADAASFAINDPKNALFPETYAREKRGLASYALTDLPDPLPAHVGPSVAVPDFIAVGDQPGAERLAAEKGVTLSWTHEPAADGVLWHIVRQDPPAGTPVARGAEVQLTSTSGRALLLYTVPGLLENLASRNR
jgi:hypothetical protein